MRIRPPCLSERDIQKILFYHFINKNHKYITPNTLAFASEADLISITGSDYAIEYEIKTSRQDFFRDLNKTRKHAMLRDPMREVGRHTSIREQIASRLYYVVPGKLIELKEVPEYAGLLEIVNPDLVVCTKRAKLLHKHKVSEKTKALLATTLMWKVFTR